MAFEEEEVTWIMEQLKKAMKLAGSLGVKGEGWEALRKSMSSVSECYFHSVNGTEERESLLCGDEPKCGVAALLEVIDGTWVFAMAVLVIGEEGEGL
ncbi:hypothetical protein CK203_041184 [Vitis vinifera]|uniref:Uncharacterized protein n=1 Tax=Vitis vinifera TaxID=29760 RepID=A0A438HT90_VITVI|nr:hypothetical protein CK203_041184 [Vitis vinifera]